MAEKGRGKKVRFQGGTVYPVIVALVMIIGLLLVVYSRTNSYASAPGPKASKRDHYHIAYGIYNCNAWAPNLTGNKESAPRYAALGVHSHDDGVIHYHPSTSAASGRNASLKRFLEVYDVTLTNTKLTLPADQGGLVLQEGVTKCKDANGKDVDGELKVVVWDDANKPNDFKILTANMADARVTRNGMAMAIAFVPAGTAVPLPESAATLATLGASDVAPTTTIAGSTVAGSDSTVAGSGTTVSDTGTTVVGEPSATTAASTATTVAGSTATTEPATTTSG